MSKIKLIASDLDGTLLLNGARKCDPILYPIVSELVDKGIYFVPASGRQYPSLQKLFAPVKDKLTYLCENGALVMHLDQVLVKSQFDDGLAMELIHAVLDQEDCEVLISGERTSYLIPKKQEFVRHIRDDVGNQVSVVERAEDIEEPIIKVSFRASEDKLEAAAEQFRKMFQDKCLIMTSGNTWTDFIPFGTGKGPALKRLGEVLGIKPQEMVAFGDNENDRDMLEFVGNPYLMEICNPTMEDVKAKRCAKVEEVLKEILEGLE